MHFIIFIVFIYIYIWPWDALGKTPALLGQVMDRSLAVGATGGSLSAILLRFLSAALDPAAPSPDCGCDCDCPICADLPTLIIRQLDLFSVLVGLLIGLLIGPVLDLLHLLRQSWSVWLRTRLAQLAEENPLYRLA